MSHRPPQHPANMDMFGFGAPVGTAIDPMQMQTGQHSSQPPGSQGAEDAVMSFLDSSFLSQFDPSGLSMLDSGSVSGGMSIAQPPPHTHLDSFQRPLAPAPTAPPPAPPPAVPAAIAGIFPGEAGAGAVTPHSTSISAPPATVTIDLDGQNKLQQGVSSNNPGTGNGNNTSSSLGGPQPLMSATPVIPGSTVTEYTKKRDWAAKTVGELADLQQILDTHGRIKYVSPSVTTLTGYKREELLDLFLRDLIHPDDVGVFVAELNEAIATGATMRVFFRLRKKDGTYGIFESVGHGHIAAAKFAPNPNNQSQFCQAVFLMSRPYPTQSTGLLDSFLEHKIENERLRRRIAELRREEDEEEETQRQWQASHASHEGPRSEITASEDAHMTGGGAGVAQDGSNGNSNNPTDRRPGGGGGGVNAALTRENLEGSIAGSAQDSISDKMARYSGMASHAETIEMLTGLRYQEGERSRLFSHAGGSSPLLVRGDVGIAISVDRDRESRGSSDKKKKQKRADEYVCTDCGTLDSPEWRKGPSGPKTLCNACGLRWAKREKKRNAKAAKPSSTAGGGGAGGGGGGLGPGAGSVPVADPF